LNDLAEQFTNKPVVFISVTSENEDVVRLFLKSHPMITWVGLDDYEVLNKEFHVEGIPHAVRIRSSPGKSSSLMRPVANLSSQPVSGFFPDAKGCKRKFFRVVSNSENTEPIP
jgi:hypothetical protein